MTRLAMLLCCAAATWAQSRSMGNGSVTTKGLQFVWDTRVEPALPQVQSSSFGTSGPSADGWVTKAMIDRKARTYFGYEVQLSPVSDGVRLEFRPLQVTAAMNKQWRIEDPSSWRTLNVQVPQPQTIRPGDVIAIELMRNPSSGQKIVDYVSVQANELHTFANINDGARTFTFVGGEPHDFRVEDAELNIWRPHLTITSGQGSAEHRSDVGVSGRIFWFVLPGKGRYALSVLPRPGFQRAGDIRGTLLRFAVGDETFTMTSAQTVLGGGPYNLYVRHEPGYRNELLQGFQIGAQDFWGI